MNKLKTRLLPLVVVLSAWVVAIALHPTNVQAQDQTAVDDHCGYTDETTSGPYYISGTRETDNLNTQGAPGEPMQISGVIYDGSTGEPIPNAQVEVWHTDADGVYPVADQGKAAAFNEKDLNLRGTVLANDQGEYQFTSILPGVYEGRRRHIHYYITAPGYLPLFTQTYWKDDPVVNDGVDQNTEACRVLTFTALEKGGTATTFDIYLRPDPNYVPTAEATAQANAEPVVCTKLNLNDLTGDQLLTAIPNFSNRMVREFMEYRPYVSIQQFRREIGKYVDEQQVAEWEQYVYVPIDPNASDAETLKQLPGVDDASAASLIAARPYTTTAAFQIELAKYVTAQQLAEAVCYLAASA